MKRRKALILLASLGLLLVISIVGYNEIKLANLKSSWYEEYQQLEKDAEIMQQMTYSGRVVSVFGDRITVEITQASDESLIGKKHRFYLNDHSYIQLGTGMGERDVIRKGAEVNVLAYKDMIAAIHIDQF